MTARLLVIGESVLDIVRDADGVREHAGGSPLNVACGLGRLDVDVRFLTFLGDDAAGVDIQSHLLKAGVALVDGSVCNGARTSTAIATIGPDGDADYEFDIVWSLPAAHFVELADWVHVGSLATFLEPGATSVEEFLRSLPPHAIVSYDPNIRPRLLHNHAASVVQFEKLAALADVVKLSDEDSAWLYPGMEHHVVIRRILDLGVSVVALTSGEDGALLATAANVIDVPSVRVEVVDTIGAGDTFMATLIADLCEGLLPPGPERLHAVGQRAVAAAALTCARAGAYAPTLNEIAETQ